MVADDTHFTEHITQVITISSILERLWKLRERMSEIKSFHIYCSSNHPQPHKLEVCFTTVLDVKCACDHCRRPVVSQLFWCSQT